MSYAPCEGVPGGCFFQASFSRCFAACFSASPASSAALGDHGLGDHEVQHVVVGERGIGRPAALLTE